ncbi:MAG: hypothetical protein M1337_07650 [Actinobacteria bacterium]|nr:hypothetical protein [Actinomycetota bacterium]
MSGNQSVAFGINNAGEVVGGSEEVDLTSNTPGTSYVFHAVMWDNGTAVDLGVLDASPFSLAYGINDSAQVVGVVVPEAPGALVLAAGLLGFAGLLVRKRGLAAV